MVPLKDLQLMIIIECMCCDVLAFTHISDKRNMKDKSRCSAIAFSNIAAYTVDIVGHICLSNFVLNHNI